MQGGKEAERERERERERAHGLGGVSSGGVQFRHTQGTSTPRKGPIGLPARGLLAAPIPRASKQERERRETEHLLGLFAIVAFPCRLQQRQIAVPPGVVSFVSPTLLLFCLYFQLVLRVSQQA